MKIYVQSSIAGPSWTLGKGYHNHSLFAAKENMPEEKALQIFQSLCGTGMAEDKSEPHSDSAPEVIEKAIKVIPKRK